MSYNYLGGPFGTKHIPALFGLKGDHLPTDGLPRQVVNGVTVWVEPAKADPAHRKSSKHRAMCACPTCGKALSIGRLGQHNKIHKNDNQVMLGVTRPADYVF